MTDEKRTMIEDLITKLKQERDELNLKMHLGKADLKDEWEEVQKKLDQLLQRYEPLTKAVSETSDDLWEAVKLVGEEIKEGFHRIRKSL